MKLTYASRRRRKYRHLSFNPNSEFVAEAIEEFLRSGGEITQLESRPEKKQENWIGINDNKEADEFLNES